MQTHRLAIALLLAASIAFCHAANDPLTNYSPTSYPLTVTDDFGHRLTLPQAPGRISSKTLFTDEVLLSLVSPTKLTSLTNLAADPSYSNVHQKLPEGVPLIDLNVEAIIANRPDLVFAANWSDAGKITQLRNAGINVYLIDTPTTLEQIRHQITKLGGIVGHPAEAEAVLKEMDERLARLAGQVASIAEQQLVALDYNRWGTASGTNSTWHAVLEASGLINGAAQFTQNEYGGVPMSFELIVAINPDVLFVMGSESETETALEDQVLSDPALRHVNAVKYQRVINVPSYLRGTYSQYILDSVEFVVTELLELAD